jgi:hypothetical protein
VHWFCGKCNNIKEITKGHRLYEIVKYNSKDTVIYDTRNSFYGKTLRDKLSEIMDDHMKTGNINYTGV